MRRLLTFSCEGQTLGASIEGDGRTGILMVMGGGQTRVGSHRMYERLGKSLAGNGYAVFRFDRRGIGDSEGHDRGFRASGPDLAAAAAAFRAEHPRLERMFGFGLCDGGTGLVLYGASAGLSGLVLVNPWLVEAASGEPPPAAIKRHYRQQLLSVEGWKKILTGSLSYRKLITGLGKIAAGAPAGLAAETANALRSGPPAMLILARDDATAVAAEAEWKSARFAAVRTDPIYVETDSHTFARAGDAEALLRACLQAIERLG